MAAASLAWAARLGPTMLMGVALFGYLARLGLITVAVLAVAGAGWVNVIPLGLALVVTHLGLLVWEARYVSMSLAWPGVKPRKESA
jgi:ABC-type nickel/cobalt efflux system permease component RcnA